ncbi:hypothetical protein AA313_de0207835 [Arthrobotrys entomopaga]|nr:hypothetical protein AA313_de0207835 [Arthrobotrys entomopaga]
MATIFKRMVKSAAGRKDRTSKDLSIPSKSLPNSIDQIQGDSETVNTRQESAFAVSYNRSPPSPDNFSARQPSAFAVEYDRSAPRESAFAPIAELNEGYNKPYQYPYPHDPNDYSTGYNRGPPPLPQPDSERSVMPVAYSSKPPPQIPAHQAGNGSGAPARYGQAPPDTNLPSSATFAPVSYPGTFSPEAVSYPRYQPVASPQNQASQISSPAMVMYNESPAYGSLNAPIHPSMRAFDPQNITRPPSYANPTSGYPIPSDSKVTQYPSYGNQENATTQRHGQQEHEWMPQNGNTDRTRFLNEAPSYPEPRYENATASNPHIPKSNNSSSSSLYAPPMSGASSSTAPTSVYTPDRPTYQPNPPPAPRPALKTNLKYSGESSSGNYAQYSPSTNTITKPTPTTNTPNSPIDGESDPNVSKYVVRVFCQRKREEGDTLEESPRDIREFRLVNLALIKLTAGAERYVLLDAVFGELDKAIAPLLEKHWYVTPNTRIEECRISGGVRTVKIERVMVAYKGVESVIYVEFKSAEDYKAIYHQWVNADINLNHSMDVNDILQQITTIALSGLHHRHRSMCSTAMTSDLPTTNTSTTTSSTAPSLTPSNNYLLKTVYPHYTPPSPALEHLFMEATSCRSSHPALEVLVDVWNCVIGANGVYPPYQLGVSGEEGVLSVYRSFKGEDLNLSLDRKLEEEGKRNRKRRVEWSDIMFGVWRGYSCCCCIRSSCTGSTEDEGSDDRGLNETGGGGVDICTGSCGDATTTAVTTTGRGLKYVAIPEVNNKEVKLVAGYAFGKRGLDVERDILVVDRHTTDLKEGDGTGLGWTLFDAFLGTASVKAIQRMAVDHRDEMGHVIPSRVFVKYSRFEYPGEGNILLPNLLVEMRRYM